MTREEQKELFCKPTDERALLSYCLKNIDKYYDLVHKLSHSDFLYSDHDVVFTLLGCLVQQGVKTFDLPMLINSAQESGVLANIGGIDYLRSINEMNVSDDNFNIYFQTVLEASTKFKLYNLLKENIKLIESNAKEGKTSADLIGSIETNVLDLSTESKAIREPMDLAEGLSELIEERKLNEVKQMGISTGFPILDFQIDGLVPGTLNIISARLKVGKSAVLSNIAAHVAYVVGIPVLYIDTEMSFGQWRDRIIASMSGVRERDIKHGGYNAEIYDKIINKCVKIVDNGKLFHEFMPGYNVEKIVALYKKYKLKHNIGLMIFDYIKEPDSSSLDRQRKEYQVLGDVTTKLKDLAGELDIPALAAAQINRANDIADSDRIARYADVICQLMVKTEEELEDGGDKGGTHKLVVRETRRGGSTPSEGISFKFFKEQLSIKEVNAPDQLIPYGERVINSGSASDDEIG
jgi:replicative DNA helicase